MRAAGPAVDPNRPVKPDGKLAVAVDRFALKTRGIAGSQVPETLIARAGPTSLAIWKFADVWAIHEDVRGGEKILDAG